MLVTTVSISTDYHGLSEEKREELLEGLRHLSILTPVILTVSPAVLSVAKENPAFDSVKKLIQCCVLGGIDGVSVKEEEVVARLLDVGLPLLFLGVEEGETHPAVYKGPE